MAGENISLFKITRILYFIKAKTYLAPNVLSAKYFIYIIDCYSHNNPIR